MFCKRLFVVLCIVASYANATQCEDKRCVLGHIGVGGAYYDFGSADISSYAAYLSLESRYVYHRRFQSIIGGRIGGGSTSAQNTGDLSITDKNNLFTLDYYVKIGLNIAGKNAPLFVNLVVEDNKHDGRIGKGSGLERQITTLGGDIEGYIPLVNMSYLDYGAGYAWAGIGKYTLTNDVVLNIKDYSYTINAYIGYSKHITQNTMWYVKLIGKYFDLKDATNDSSTLVYPSSKDFVGMIEIGFKGFGS